MGIALVPTETADDRASDDEQDLANILGELTAAVETSLPDVAAVQAAPVDDRVEADRG
jgi:hypothetical protein